MGRENGDFSFADWLHRELRQCGAEVLEEPGAQRLLRLWREILVKAPRLPERDRAAVRDNPALRDIREAICEARRGLEGVGRALVPPAPRGRPKKESAAVGAYDVYLAILNDALKQYRAQRRVPLGEARPPIDFVRRPQIAAMVKSVRLPGSSSGATALADGRTHELAVALAARAMGRSRQTIRRHLRSAGVKRGVQE
jgi:hypothetical protein